MAGGCADDDLVRPVMEAAVDEFDCAYESSTTVFWSSNQAPLPTSLAMM